MIKDLGRWQIFSFISRILAMIPGWIQSFIFIGLLSRSGWGTVKHAVAIGASVGILQHLGLASTSTREISNAKNDTEVFKLFLTSLFIRYLVNIPIALGLFFGAEYLAVTKYSNPELIIPLKIYAFVLVAQGAQSILNSVIAGTQRFKNLFVYQSVIAYVSLLVYVPLVYFYKIPGYFISMLVFNVISTVTLAILAFKPLKFTFSMPTKFEFKVMFRDLLSISLALYATKIIYTNWENLGNNLVGGFIGPAELALFSFAALYSKKLMHISDSATDVSLPVFSERFTKDIEEFKQGFAKNFNKLFVIIVFTAVTAGFWSREIIYIVLSLVIRLLTGVDRFAEYEGAIILISPLIISFMVYSFLNLLSSGIFVPAKLIKEMIAVYATLILSTLGFYFGTRTTLGHLSAISWGMAFGALVSFLTAYLVTNSKLKFAFVNIDHAAIILMVGGVLWLSNVESILLKIVFFGLQFVLLYYSVVVSGFIPKQTLGSAVSKLKGFVKK